MYSKINVILLCGGRGTRLFPLSRDDQPKQFMPIGQDYSTLFHKTYNLAKNFSCAIYIATNNRYVNNIVGYNLDFDKIISEPCSRNTAPSILATLLAVDQKDDEIFIVMPCDHNISDITSFELDLNKAIKYAYNDNIVTFGITVTNPNTGFGYIEKTDFLEDKVYKSKRFIEKPEINIATGLFNSGNYLWNSGIYVGKKSCFISEYQKSDINFFNLIKSSIEFDDEVNNIIDLNLNYTKTESVSIDRKISEQCQNVVVIEASFLWSDVGSFETLAAITNLDIECYQNDSHNNNIFNLSSNKIYLNGVNDLNIISTNDSIFISGKYKDLSDIYTIAQNHTPEIVTSTAFGIRPWGHYEVLHQDEGCKIKKLILLPESEISLQYHNFRSEYWVIISGNGHIELNNNTIEVRPGNSITIKPGDIHRLRNQSNVENLILIEVQSGEKLLENDIVRLTDKYNRTN